MQDNNESMIEKKQGILRIIYANKYSWQGLCLAIKYETAFRQEVILFIVATFISFFLDISGIERLALIGSILFILIVELFNSAIECVVDRISLEHDPLSGRAKDYGALAVLLSFLLAISIWIIILI